MARVEVPWIPEPHLSGGVVGHVTNGVHMPSWDSEAADSLWAEACGQGRWLGTTDALAQAIRLLPVRQPEARPRAIFLGDYDMPVAELLVQGVDVWIHTPSGPGRRSERAA